MPARLASARRGVYEERNHSLPSAARVVHVSAQEKSYITVRGSELNNGVVIRDVLKAGKAYELQCNQAEPGCTTLKNGKYQNG